jgi:hypothetical protein
MSASERKILRLQAEVEQLQEAQREYSLVLNYLVYTHQGKFRVFRPTMDEMMKTHFGKLRTIRSEILPDGDMVWTFGDAPPTEEKLIKLG